MNRMTPLVVYVALASLSACRPDATHRQNQAREKPWPEFHGTAAYEEVANLSALGSRAQGSPGNRHAAHYIMARLKASDLSPSFILFTNQTPYGEIVFRNIECILPGKESGLILVTTHYDSLYNASEDFEAANSAGSGPAVLLEIARVLHGGYDGSGPEIRLIFFDGQEPLRLHTDGDGLRGSRFYAGKLVQDGDTGRVIAAINLDMVGDRDLTITLPRNTSSELRRRFLDAAHAENARQYVYLLPLEIGDDHDPFRDEGIPAINVIDFQFGSERGRNNYWRTPEDTLDKVSADSLDITGRVTLRMIRDLVSRR